MRYLLIFCLLFSGCASNIQIIPTTIKIHKHQWDKDTGICWICKTRYSPMRKREVTTSKKYKSSKVTIVKAITEEFSLDEPNATILWERYKRSNSKSFVDYLLKYNPLWIRNDLYILLVERIKTRTKILKRTK